MSAEELPRSIRIILSLLDVSQMVLGLRVLVTLR